MKQRCEDEADTVNIETGATLGLVGLLIAWLLRRVSSHDRPEGFDLPASAHTHVAGLSRSYSPAVRVM